MNKFYQPLLAYARSYKVIFSASMSVLFTVPQGVASIIKLAKKIEILMNFLSLFKANNEEMPLPILFKHSVENGVFPTCLDTPQKSAFINMAQKTI